MFPTALGNYKCFYYAMQGMDLLLLLFTLKDTVSNTKGCSVIKNLPELWETGKGGQLAQHFQSSTTVLYTSLSVIINGVTSGKGT